MSLTHWCSGAALCTPSLFKRTIVSVFATSCLSTSAWADVPLPYSTRTKAYSGYSTTVRGDIVNIGMADAGVAIPGTISALENNPAGLAMTMGSLSAQISSNEMDDRGVTGSDRQKIRSSLWGVSLTPDEWGYSIASYSPSFEGAKFINTTSGEAKHLQVSHRQFRFSAARAVLNKKLSLGASLQLDQATRSVEGTNSGAAGISFKLGTIYHWKKHILFGASYSPAQEIGGSGSNIGGTFLPGFVQPIRTPMLLNVGAGWIPNRFFHVGFSLLGVGKTKDTALLRDENMIVGRSFTFQPRIGATYTIAQYHWLKVSTSMGFYYEDPRIEGIPKRMHSTFAFQVNPYFLNLGFGLDRAERFNNLILSFGIDIVRTMRTFKLIPPDPVPPYRGTWPKPLQVKADGLPEILTHGEKRQYSAPSVGDVKSIIEEIPANIENQLKGEPTEFEKRKQRQKRRKKRKSAPKPAKNASLSFDLMNTH